MTIEVKQSNNTMRVFTEWNTYNDFMLVHRNTVTLVTIKNSMFNDGVYVMNDQKILVRKN